MPWHVRAATVLMESTLPPWLSASKKRDRSRQLFMVLGPALLGTVFPKKTVTLAQPAGLTPAKRGFSMTFVESSPGPTF
jgi:hypothetical protein